AGIKPGFFVSRSQFLDQGVETAPQIVQLPRHRPFRESPPGPPWMWSFGELLNHLAIKCWYVRWFATRHQSIIHHDDLVHPFSARIFQIGLDRRIRSELSAFGYAGVNQS